jgi:uncharacterized tellurite resistance protein B-like protein
VDSLLRFLGVRGASQGGAGETETVRRIAARLDRLDPAQAKYLAAFAYVLARVAQADLHIDESETTAMEKAVRGAAGLSEAEVALVVEIAKSQARLLGGTENYVVTREFKAISTPEQRARLLECLFEVAAADGTIETVESAEIAAIGEEIGFTRPEINALRAAYRERLAEFKKR